MNKDAYYFSHDSNAKDDPKCMLLIDQLGLEGYGIFWVLVEILRDQPEYKYPTNLIPIIARRYNTTSEKMKAVVLNYGLFTVDEDDNFFSLSLNNRMQHLASVREKRRIAGIASGKVRKQKALNKCSTNVQHKQNKNEQSKVKESKVKEIKNKVKVFSDEIKNFTAELSKYFPVSRIHKLSKKDKYNWVDVIDKLIRLDGYTKQEIKKAVENAVNDEFWSKQFHSLTKLRRKNEKQDCKHIVIFLSLSDSMNKSGYTSPKNKIK